MGKVECPNAMKGSAFADEFLLQYLEPDVSANQVKCFASPMGLHCLQPFWRFQLRLGGPSQGSLDFLGKVVTAEIQAAKIAQARPVDGALVV